MERGNYHGLKLTEQVMKVLERIVPLQTVGVNQQFPVWLRPRQRPNSCNLCCQAAARDVSSCHGFRRPGEGIWSSASEGHLVGIEKSWCGGVDCATGAGDVCQCVEPFLHWWEIQWKVWRSVFTKAQYSVLCSSSLCLKLCHVSSAFGSPGRTSMLMTLLSLLNRFRNVSEGSLLEMKQWRRKDWEYMQERQRSWSVG